MTTTQSRTAAGPGTEAIDTGGTAVTRALLDVLQTWGVQRLYCCPGSTEAALLDALVTRDSIELVLVTHESVAVSMAEGDARATGRPAVAYVHTHLGMANALAHLSSAQLAHAPVIVLNGLKASTLAGRGAFTTLAHPRDMVRQHVKWSHVCASADRVADDVDRALHLATTEPAGPVWLGLPQDLLETELAVASAAVASRRVRSEVPALQPAAGAVDAAAQLLGGARRPVLVAGGELVRLGAVDVVLALARRLNALVFDESRRDFLASCVPTDSPWRGGLYDAEHPAVRDADVLAFLGCRMFTEFEAGAQTAELPPEARLIHLHVDPAELGRLHPVDVALPGDPALTLTAVLDALGAPPVALETAVAAAPVARPTAPPANPRLPGHAGLGPVLDALAEAVEATGATVVLDATTATVPLLRALRTSRPGQLLSSTSGSLGWGMGAALGVQLADPDRPVLAVLGDGAFQFGLPALWTAHHSGIPVTYVVLNNRTYAAVASALHRFDGAAVRRDSWPGTDISGLDIAAVASAFGIAGTRIAGAGIAGLGEAVAAALRDRRPAVFDVITGPHRSGERQAAPG